MAILSLDPVFRALGDPTRRRVVERLGRGPASVSELAAPFDMALPSFLKHLRVLEESGLIRSEKAGRVRTCTLQRDRLDSAATWLEEQRSMWEARFGRLDALLASDPDPPSGDSP